MTIKLDHLRPEEAWIVKWQYQLLDGFDKKLFETIVLADESNLKRLHLGFPDQVNGYLQYTRLPGWWPSIQEKIGMAKALKEVGL